MAGQAEYAGQAGQAEQTERAGRATRLPGHAAWRTALPPVLMVLGIALPLSFLARVSQYLYYLRPSELLPTYATAWLLLAVLCLPAFLIAASALSALRLGSFERPRRLLGLLLLWAAAAAAVAPFLLDLATWLRAFDSSAPAGMPPMLEVALAAGALILAVPLAFTHRGRHSLQGLLRVATLLAALGGVTMLSLPFFRWGAAATAQALPPASGGAPGLQDAPARTAASASTGTPAPGGARSARPNIVLLTIDALSAQHMSLYGAKRPTTPSLDAFARHATVFDRAYANANFTTAGVATILTGTRPWTHRAFEVFSWPIAAARRVSLPAVLARAGYQTGYVATNPYAGASRIGLGPYFEFRRSDEVPIGVACPDRIAVFLPYECPAAQVAPLVLAQQLWNIVQYSLFLTPDNRHYDPRRAIEPALAWLSAVDRRRPVFLWVHLFPPHAPYAAPAPWLGRFDASAMARTAASSDPVELYAFREVPPRRVQALEARYDEAVQYVDYYAGEFLAGALERLGPDTAVVVTADHGESFAHGYGGHAGPGLYDSIIHIPLIIKLPRQADAERVGELVQQIDIAPTLAALAGVGAPALWEGRSLLPLWPPTPSPALTARTPEDSSSPSR